MTVSATISDSAPGDNSFTNATSVYRPGQDPLKAPNLSTVTIGKEWFETYGVRLAAGRLLDVHHRQDDMGIAGSSAVNAVINRSALRLLGFRNADDAVGKTVNETNGDNVPQPRVIVGVIDDVRFHSPREKLGGTMYRYSSQPLDYTVATLRYRGDPKVMTQAAVHGVWQAIGAGGAVQGEDRRAEPRRLSTKQDDHATQPLHHRLRCWRSLIGCVGLWGLASFNTARRTKEIGIRKTLGASSRRHRQACSSGSSCGQC